MSNIIFGLLVAIGVFVLTILLGEYGIYKGNLSRVAKNEGEMRTIPTEQPAVYCTNHFHTNSK